MGCVTCRDERQIEKDKVDKNTRKIEEWYRFSKLLVPPSFPVIFPLQSLSVPARFNQSQTCFNEIATIF